MTSIKDRSQKVLSVEKSINDLSINRQVFFDIVEKLDIKLLIYPPDNAEVHLVEKHYYNPKMRLHFPNYINSSLTINVTKAIKFICLSPKECKAALRFEGLKQSKFHAVAKHCAESDEIIITYPHSNTKGCQQRGLLKSPYLDGLFITTKLNPPSQDPKSTMRAIEKPIKIKPKKMFILSEDLKEIRKELNHNTDYENFKPGKWTSLKLAQLNEASTHFFSENNLNGKHPDDIETIAIEKWLRTLWGPNSGVDLTEQAINAILPDHRYSNSPPKDRVSNVQRKKYNTYTSTTLVMINEIAIKYWLEMIDRGRIYGREKYPTRDSIKTELSDTSGPWKVTARLAAAIATIIKPDDADKTKKQKNEKGPS
ncbi:hypothetical protein LJY18_08215 [Pseudomonas sp. MMS21-TM103]|uniref:hypothetical protein n=1 Tax=Pseudomonas sp. MMS21 TM103 TaxID=2886506 RepID=UPI001EDD0E3A|nr:hypothetical protein [Pseudomonas sp. MMS21 TM103]MCG4453292.1 hypothetical protein [Pseudomonas sp. MMS21 TM103]